MIYDHPERFGTRYAARQLVIHPSLYKEREGTVGNVIQRAQVIRGGGGGSYRPSVHPRVTMSPNGLGVGTPPAD